MTPPTPTIPILINIGEDLDTGFVDPATIEPTMFTKPKFLKGVFLGLGDMVAEHEALIRVLEILLKPILWICYNQKCGAPITIPRILFPGNGNGFMGPLYCPICYVTAPFDYYKQFL